MSDTEGGNATGGHGSTGDAVAEAPAPPPPAPPLPSAPPPPAAPPWEAAPAYAMGMPGVAVPALTTPGRRLGQALLDGVLAVVTLGIGWFIWSLFIWRRGETPGMQILRMKVVRADTGQQATWGTMFVRELLAKGLLMSIISGIFVPAAIVLDFMLLWDRRNQELWDKIAGTVVVDNR
jgi:uncharacterized RDD family membrane protein YckC